MESSDESVATVLLNGTNLVITPVSQGSTNITVTAIDDKGAAITDTFVVAITETKLIATNILLQKGRSDMSPVVITFDKPLSSSTLAITNINDLLDEPSFKAHIKDSNSLYNYPLHSFVWDNTDVNNPKLILHSTHTYRSVPASVNRGEVIFKDNAVITTDNKVYAKAESILPQ